MLGPLWGGYNELGNLLVELTLKRDEHAAQAIARRLEDAIAERMAEVTGRGYSQQEISDYLHGRRTPGPEFIHAFAETFSLNELERRLVAWTYTFSEFPPV